MNEIIQTRHGEALPFLCIEYRDGTLEVILELINQ
jgi:hypothetical protein|tara:strand:- start:391 stop:495 length:105 start_codon:yes stop_codon:yes gene_type:complete